MDVEFKKKTLPYFLFELPQTPGNSDIEYILKIMTLI